MTYPPELIEAVARGLHEHDPANDARWEEVAGWYQERFKKIALAALKARDAHFAEQRTMGNIATGRPQTVVHPDE